MDRVKRVDNLDTGDKSLAYANLPLGEWDPVETITQDRHEDILFFENILFFIADHELAYVSECRKTLHCKGGDQPLTCSIVDMALWWRKRGEGGVPARGG